MYRALGIAALLCLAMPATLRAQETCSPADLEKIASRVKDVQKRLIAVGGDVPDSTVPPSTRADISVMKDSLATMADGYLGCKHENAADAKQIETGLAELLGANKQTSELADYGADLHIAVTRPDDKADIIGVQMSFNVMCGDDTILVLYEWENKGWRQILRWQSKNYDDTYDAFGGFFGYAVVPGENAGSWVVAVAHGQPKCAGRWVGLQLDMIARAHQGTPQRVLFHLDTAYDAGNETGPPITVKSRSDGFELRVPGPSMDLHIYSRTRIYRYRVLGTEVKRRQPVAVNGRDFVDEWLASDWEDARSWTDSKNANDLESKHADILKLSDPINQNFTYGPVRPCLHDPKRFQVELDVNPGSPIYFGILEGENSFTMLSALDQPDSTCKGADIMRKPANSTP
jgi:hypothetical protein